MVIKFLNEKRINFNKKRTVQVSFECLSIGELDTLNEKLTAELIVRSTWYTDEEDAINYDPKVHWNPKLYFDNALSIKDQQIFYESHVVEENTEFDCKITEVQRINAEFWEKFELEKVILILLSINDFTKLMNCILVLINLFFIISFPWILKS